MSILYSCTDKHGHINVLDDGQFRVLSFADGDEQSRMKLATPETLQHEYTQAMLLVMLFTVPKRVTILGLGGGCLVSCLHHHIPGVHLVAVELRRAVIDIAERFFRLPVSKKITIIEADARDYLANDPDKKADILFADIYNHHGMDKLVLQDDFIEKCDNQLKDTGWLVLNCWSEDTRHPELIENLRHYFFDIRAVNTGCGNWIVFASRDLQSFSEKALKLQAQKLSSTLGFNLNRWLSRLVEV